MKLTVRKKEKKYIKNNDEIIGIVYGGEIENTSLVFNLKDFEKIYEQVGNSGLIELDIDGNITEVVVKDVQLDHRTGNYYHIDFYAITRGQEMEANVAFEFIGESAAAKKGGVLNTSLTEITIKALPKNLPSTIEIDLGELKEIGQSIRLSDINLPEGVSYLDDIDMETSIVSIIEAKTVEEEEEKNEGVPDLTTEEESKEDSEEKIEDK